MKHRKEDSRRHQKITRRRWRVAATRWARPCPRVGTPVPVSAHGPTSFDVASQPTLRINLNRVLRWFDPRANVHPPGLYNQTPGETLIHSSHIIHCKSVQ